MNKIKEFLKQVITSHSGISSKRVCGCIGFLVIVFVLIFCTVLGIQAPGILETFIWAVCMLLGIDSIMSPFCLKNKNTNKINSVENNTKKE